MSALQRFAIVLALVLASAGAGRADTRVPLGFLLLCVEQPAECEAGGETSIVVTEDIATTLEQINSVVNHSITPRRDDGADIWTLNASEGDCEDYVLTKRHKLIGLGLPPSALRIAYVITAAQEGHAILVVKTNGGDLVLDNLHSSVTSLTDSGYHIVSMSGPDPLVWS